MLSNLSFYIICGGFHPHYFNINFFNYLTTIINDISPENTIFITGDNFQPYDGLNIYKYILKNKAELFKYNLTFIGFSAGVVGSIIAGNLWKKKGGKVNTLLAFDGWGVPLISSNFPCYRISHDYATHLIYLGGEKNAFYAFPPVPHLKLWSYPENIQGYWEITSGIKKRANLTDFIKFCLKKDGH
ncbi:hypothetical protein [Geminocystis sp. GBBB08]|uniref:hypothetical protein n=1 Tax=Geminocystis sp. GBBB08 TaxID=2604140 RepID=UPI0027E30A3A|nr:hypothetical protein [Geminocystis sp. GBBB08]MBL1209265.1 hypothetical protein [Geminocystis sp. GBBB08]